MTSYDELPPFANEEVRAKFASYQKNAKAADAASLKAQELSERIKQMTELFTNVSSEIESTQQVLELDRAELARQEHEKAVATLKIANFKQEKVSLDKDREKVADSLLSISKQTSQSKSKLAELETKLNVTQKQLEEWRQKADKKAEDEGAMSRYHAADQVKLVELQRHSTELNMQRAKLVNSIAEVESENRGLNLEITKTAEDIRTASEGRSSEIAEWERVLHHNQARDSQVKDLGERFIAVSSRLRERKQQVARIEQTAKTLQSAATRKQKDADTAERTTAGLKEQLEISFENLREIREAVATAKISVEAADAELKAKQQELVLLVEQNKSREKRLAALRARLDAEKIGLNELQSGKLDKVRATAAAKAAAEEGMRKLGEKEKEKRTALHSLTTAQAELSKQRDLEMSSLGEISGAMSNERGLKTEGKKLRDEAARQEQMIYVADFEGQLLHRNIDRLSGVRTAEEKLELSKQSADLESQLAELNRQLNLLCMQNKKLDNEIKIATKQSMETENERARVEQQVIQSETEVEVSTREAAALVREGDRKTGYRDSLKVELKDARAALKNALESAIKAEADLAQFTVGWVEREKTLASEVEAARHQVRYSEEQRHVLAMKLTQVVDKVSQLRTKFEHMTRCRVGEDGQTHNQVYFLVKAAKEKTALQKRGDELNLAVQKAEKETRALEKSLDFLKHSNKKFAEALRAKPAEGPDEIWRLEDLIKESNDALHKLNRSIQDTENRMPKEEALKREKDAIDAAEAKYEELLRVTAEMRTHVAAQAAHASEIERSARVIKSGLPIEAIMNATQKAHEALLQLAHAEPEMEAFVESHIELRLLTN